MLNILCQCLQDNILIFVGHVLLLFSPKLNRLFWSILHKKCMDFIASYQNMSASLPRKPDKPIHGKSRNGNRFIFNEMMIATWWQRLIYQFLEYFDLRCCSTISWMKNKHTQSDEKLSWNLIHCRWMMSPVFEYAMIASEHWHAQFRAEFWIYFHFILIEKLLQKEWFIRIWNMIVIRLACNSLSNKSNIIVIIKRYPSPSD